MKTAARFETLSKASAYPIETVCQYEDADEDADVEGREQKKKKKQTSKEESRRQTQTKTFLPGVLCASSAHAREGTGAIVKNPSDGGPETARGHRSRREEIQTKKLTGGDLRSIRKPLPDRSGRNLQQSQIDVLRWSIWLCRSNNANCYGFEQGLSPAVRANLDAGFRKYPPGDGPQFWRPSGADRCAVSLRISFAAAAGVILAVTFGWLP